MICVDKPHLANDGNTVSIFWEKRNVLHYQKLTGCILSFRNDSAHIHYVLYWNN